jgi:anti-sigma regulatory factor (Ser/Thr protein kinase)
MDELSSAALLFSSKAYEKHLVYAVYIDPNMPQIISMDSVRVKQIFSNLLSNAIKFTPDDGAIKVKVILKNSHLIISVQDTGIGIPQKSIAKVFSAFEQADGSTTRKYGGTGLGLSISRKLAELMGGDITLQSKEGVGSTFTLTIPVTIKSEKARELLSPTITSTWRVAILGENPKSKKLTVIRKYLQDFGVTQIDELGEYKDNSYDLLFFVPDDSYNEEIVNGSTPSIALLRTSSVKLAELDHIQALYAPYTPTMVVAAIKATGIYNPQTVLES